MKSVELLLHPVRLRIVEAFLGDRELTTAALSAELDDVPAGSLYRHIARLVEHDVLEIVAERRVRGTTERTYALRADKTSIDPEQLAGMSADDHRAAFLAYIAGLVADFDRYTEDGDIDLVRDGVGYRTLGMWLDDAEFIEFIADLRKVVEPRLANKETAERSLRLMRTVFLPGVRARGR
ncbi:helix-turn-helix domain-containing protein [Nocardia sp. NPDC020380]|uniref:helix-turn-helix domain-containing protein n=1 Tax=Nocardia sp. NPDC020380 TaxID=3364309 RepID=UPI0037A76D7F